MALNQIAEQLKKVSDEDTLESIVTALPSSQGSAVLDLVYGKSPDDVWADLVVDEPGEVDVEEISPLHCNDRCHIGLHKLRR